MIEVERVKHMSIKDAITVLNCVEAHGVCIEAKDMAIKSLETIQRIDDVLNVEGMTEIDILDEIMDAVSEFKYDCGVSE